MKSNKWLLLLLLSGLLIMAGCTDANFAKFSSLGQPHIVKQYSCGKLIGEWESTGKVQSETQSDGWYFEDAATHKIVLVSGTLQITLK